MKSMATAVEILVFLVLATTVHARLNRGPTISSVVLAPQNPDVIYLRIDSLPCKAAVSTDGGKRHLACSPLSTSWSRSPHCGAKVDSVPSRPACVDWSCFWWCAESC